MNIQALQNVAKACRESQNPDKFDMAIYGWGCGTPGCALGHYAARRDLQDLLMLSKDGDLQFTDERHASRLFPEVLQHFDLNINQLDELFNIDGCNNARTPEEAATYIEEFIKQNS